LNAVGDADHKEAAVSSTEVSHTVRAYPFADAERLEPYPLYAHLRREEPLSRVQMPYGEQAWLATRYSDVRTVLGDARFSRAMAIGRDQPRTAPRMSGTGLFSMDPPDHTRLRTLVANAFTVRRVEQLRPRIQQITDDLLDRMIEQGPPADLVTQFGNPLPLTVICELFGVPLAEREQFRSWSEAVVSTTSLTLQQVESNIASMKAYMRGLIAARRENPTDDLLGAMVQARDERQDRLTEEELVHLAASLLSAGHETTSTQIPNFVYLLLTEPQRWQELCADPDLVAPAIEELMRYTPLGVASLFARYATEDVYLSGVLVRAGEPVLAAVYSANRDGEVFSDPDRIDFHREPRSHFGFGHGAHHCLGAQLVRVELGVVFRTLVRRLPGLRIAVPDAELKWKVGLSLRGLQQLPVTW
jgi:cytochrome P450